MNCPTWGDWVMRCHIMLSIFITVSKCGLPKKKRRLAGLHYITFDQAIYYNAFPLRCSTFTSKIWQFWKERISREGEWEDRPVSTFAPSSSALISIIV